MANVHRASTRDAFKHAANDFASYLKARDRHEIVTVGLCGGNTIVAFLECLLEQVEQEPGLLNNAHFFQTDEFVPDAERRESNFELLHRSFFDKLLRKDFIEESSIHRMDVNSLAEYQIALDSLGGVFSAVFLSGGGGFYSSGERDSGHCAGIFPTDSNKELAAIWEDSASFLKVCNAPKPPRTRFTASPFLLRQSKRAYGFIMGSDRADSLRNYLDESITAPQAPIKIVRQISNGILYTDI